MSISLSIINLKRRNWAGNLSEGCLQEGSTIGMNVNIKRLVVTDSTSTPLTYKLDFEVWLHKQNSVLTL